MVDITLATIFFVLMSLGLHRVNTQTRFQKIVTFDTFDPTASLILHIPLIALTLYAGWVFTPLALLVNFTLGFYAKTWAVKAKTNTHWGSS